MTREQILGEIQALRAEVARVESREHGRSINRRLRALYEAADYDVALTHVVPFALEARATITKSFGTVAWDEPETREEALARMDAHPMPAAPGMDPGRLLSDEDLAAAEAAVLAAIRWTETTGPTKVASSFDLIMAELRRLRS